MSDLISIGGMTRLPVIRTDGELRQGPLIKCNNGIWSRHDGGQLQCDNPWLVLATTRALQRFVGRIPETILPDSNGELPDVDALNQTIPREQWPAGLDGRPRPPWAKQFVAYLLDIRDAMMVTFLNSTAGAGIAVREVERRLTWKRALHSGQEIYPLTKLADAPFKTAFGIRRRPDFPILGWRQFVDGQLRAVAPLSLGDELDDSVTF